MTLGVGVKHEARALGPMMKRLTQATDWVWEEPGVERSEKEDGYRIRVDVEDVGVYQKVWVTRNHGRELTDGEGGKEMLATLPDSLWSKGAEDVGLCKMPPIKFEIDKSSIVSKRQYKNKFEAEQGITETIEGLVKAGVLCETRSNWNTPILPVLKPGTG